MNLLELTVLGFIAGASIILLFRLLGRLVEALAIIAAIANDVLDVVGAAPPFSSLLFDGVTFLLLAISYRRLWTLVSLLDILAPLLPLHVLALLFSIRR